MLSLNYKVNAFLLPLDAYYAGKNKQDAELSKIVDGVETMVRQFVLSEANIETFVNQNLNPLFDFRISALNWLIKNKIVITDFDSFIEDELSSFKTDPKFSILYQNVLFAIRTNLKSLNSLLNPSKTNSIKSELIFLETKEIPKLSFVEFLNVLNNTVPDIIISPFVDWLISSLYIEFGLVSTFVIYKKNIQIESKKVNELSAFIADAAQTFGAIAKEMNPQPSKKNKGNALSISDSFLSEQEYLAEQDIENYPINY